MEINQITLKKRLFISLLTTFLVIIFSCNFWLNYNTVQIVESIAENNKFVYIYYPKFVHAATNYAFLFKCDFLILISILTFVTALLSAGYINKKILTPIFSSSGKALYKIFTVIFILIIIFPAIYINKLNKSIAEERDLALYIPIYNKNNHKLNLNYGKNFESWIKDRFLGRMQLIYLNSHIKYYFPGRFAHFNEVVADKKNKFMYSLLRISTFNNKIDQHKIYKQLSAFDKYCKKHNIKFYIVIVPKKGMIYGSNIANLKNYEKTGKILSALNKKYDVNLIFPLKEFQAASKHQKYLLFYKTDTHATCDGAFVAYNALMSEIKKDFHGVKIVKPEDFHYSYGKKVLVERRRVLVEGNECEYAAFPSQLCNKFLDTDYRYYTHKNKAKLKTSSTETDMLIKNEYYYPQGSNLKVLVFGDSFSENLMDILPYSFRNVRKIRLNGPKNIPKDDFEQFKFFKYYGKELDNYNPDIFVIYIGYTFIKKLGVLNDLN